MLNEQPDGPQALTVEVRRTHIERATPSSAAKCAMAQALRDAGFDTVTVFRSFMRLDGIYYQLDEDLIQWQRDAISGKGMDPMAMQLDSERRSVKFLKRSNAVRVEHIHPRQQHGLSQARALRDAGFRMSMCLWNMVLDGVRYD